MTPRRLPYPRDTLVVRSTPAPAWDTPLEPVGWTRKLFALALHAACLGLFWLTVVWPVVSPAASADVAAAVRPVRQAWSIWMAQLPRRACPWVPTEDLAAHFACPPRIE